MARFKILALNTFEEVLRRKVIYILFFVAVLVGIQGAYGLTYMGMAERAGETEMLSNLRGSLVLMLFQMMEFWGMVLAIVLGSVALSSEVKNRTIVPVLSRPVGRMSFYFAKWVGTMGFLTVFIGIGVLVGLTVAFYWKLDPSPLFFLGTGEIVLHAAVLSALSIALSSLFHPVVAGGGALLIVYLPVLTRPLSGHPNPLWMFVGTLGRYLSPAEMPVSLLDSGLTKGLLDPDYGLYVSVLLENAGYAVAAVLAGALVFRMREIRIR